MVPSELEVKAEPRLEEMAEFDERLYEYNVAVTGRGDGRWLAIFARDDAGRIMAGLHGWTWGGTGFVRTLWVREDLRGRGMGARVLSAAEREAVRRGCREMHLDAHSYQAPGFYRRMGYEQLAELPGWPGAGEFSRYFFRKVF
jgi:GNAT superfamily N-acetyltransferase